MGQYPDPISTISLRIGAHEPEAATTTPDFWAAVALILAPAANGPEVLFIRRADRDNDPWSGHIALPGGRHEVGDATLRDTAERETQEEVGLTLQPTDWLGQLDDVAPSIRRLPSLAIRPFVYLLPRPRPEIIPSHEVADWFWAPLEALSAPQAGQHVPVDVHGHRRSVKAFVVDGHVIWGLTERIIRSFLALVRGPG